MENILGDDGGAEGGKNKIREGKKKVKRNQVIHGNPVEILYLHAPEAAIINNPRYLHHDDNVRVFPQPPGSG